MKYTYLLMLISFALLTSFVGIAQEKEAEQRKQLYKDGVYNPFEVLDTRVDKMKYWREAARLGLTPIEPEREVPLGTWKGSRIAAKSIVRDDSPDVPVTTQNSTQSENSIFINPNDPDHVLQSNNSTQNPVGSLYGANYFFSMDFGLTWGGSVQGAGGNNSGDPATAISLSGRQYVGYISSGYGQGVSYSDDGINWTPVIADPGSGSQILDKNHLWIDNSPISPYEGNVYVAWTDFGGPSNNRIEVVYTNNNGISYSNAVNISAAVNSGSHDQGVNVQTGPNGQVYAVWSIYDSWPSDESALGFAKSLNGGATWLPATRIITNTRGIRNSGVGKNMRVNSFPSMTVDLSGDGTIYIVWTNIGVPGVNVGPDTDIYMIKSSNEGATWSAPIRVNQSTPGQGHKHYFPWISCDPETGALSVIYYDDRNVGGNKCEVYCANSFDGGESWEDFRVSDVDFTPAPIPGLAGGYMGDYLGIASRGGRVYPVWTDNRTGVTMTYVSPYETNSLPRPVGLTAGVTFETGQVDLQWEFEPVPTFEYFVVYRNGFQIGTTTGTTFSDNLPDYGIFKFKVTAMHSQGESSGPQASVQWGDAHIAVDPTELIENIYLQSTSYRYVTIENVGQLDLSFKVTSTTEPIRGTEAYCVPGGNCSFGDGVTGFTMADISNLNSGCSPNGYGNFTNLSTELQAGNSYQITLQTGYSSQYVNIWIDANKNEIFEPSELILEGFQLANANQTYTTTVTIPEDFQSGETRMRVMAKWLSTPDNPCENMTYGEAEDYTVNISGWMYVERLEETIAPGQSATFEVMFVSDDLEQGTYYGNIKIESNDPDAPIVDIPVTLNVGDSFPLSLSVSATPSTICLGTTSQLQAGANGGSGIYTYEWTSNPPGFSSNMSNPVVAPLQTTTYFVAVDDGENTIDGQVVVTVIDTPGQAAMPQGETDLCMGVIQTVYATTGAQFASGYYWMIEPAAAGLIVSNGLTAIVTWNEAFTGSAMIMVQGYNNCGTGQMSAMMEVTMHELPTIDLGADMTVCANESVILDAGNPGATYLWSTGATTQTIVVDTTGVGIGVATFWVEVTDGNTCSNTDQITIQFDDCTGISEMSEQWTVNVFPNPSNGIFSIKISSLSSKPASLTLMNTLGTVVYQSNIHVDSSKTLNLKLTNQPDGIYYLNLKGDGVNLIKKVIIQN